MTNLKTSAKEQLEYMLTEDDDALLLTTDDEIKLEVRESVKRLLARLKVIEVTTKVLEAIGDSAVVLPMVERICMVKVWLPFARCLKPLIGHSITN
ncbi:hypothetical protein LguiA_030041 [Lonicera macranthoides]